LLVRDTLGRLLTLFVTPMLAAILLGRLWNRAGTPDPRAARLYAWTFAQAMLLLRLACAA